MNKRNLLITITLVPLTFLVAGCGSQTKTEPAVRFTETPTSVPPSKTPTITPSPEPTSTPTFTPTPIGGSGGLLLYNFECTQDGICEPKIFLYDLLSHKLIEFLNGYAPLDVSPDGRKVLLLKYTDSTFQEGDLFFLDLQEPDKLDLLQESVNDATWLGDSDWIGFVSPVNGKRQGFIVHPDGSGLIQMTNSTIGVVEFEPVFYEGVFWSEGIVGTRSIQTSANKLTKLDKTELQFTNFEAVTADGKYVITRSMDTSGFELTDVATSEIKEVLLSKPDENSDFQVFSIRPLSEDKWLIGSSSPTSEDGWEYLVYSSDGILMARLPTEYRILNASGPPESYDLLSPDAVWILVQKFEKISGNQYNVTCCYLFNTLTSELKDIPDLRGAYAFGYFWVKIENYDVLKEISQSLLGSNATGYAWEFEVDGNTEGWVVRNQLDSLQVANGNLMTNSTGNDPYMVSPMIVADASALSRVELRLKVSAGNSAQLFFITNTDRNYDETKSLRFQVHPDGELHTYTLDMAGKSKWSDVIRQLRLDPTDTQAVIEIDYIRVTSP